MTARKSNAMTDKPSHPANRLAHEKSPYLLQHQFNPVDWYPWGPEAFARARAELKPIFLSIGYSTCHWCHVMERETFEQGEVAAFLKEHFISVKVDREERPDVDKIYMTFVQATAGQGGWPLTVFLSPDLKPFYGGTYFPPEPRHGRPAFLQLLQAIQQQWSTRRSDLLQSADELHERLLAFTTQADAAEGDLIPALLDQAAQRFKSEYDPQHGGFGGAPKFPRPSQPSFLLRHAARNHDTEARQMVLHTCDRMAAGGIHDQLGGGFHRYAVDGEWLVPHFEKMLYDNAQLACLYLDAFQVTREPRYANTARATLDYVASDLTHPEGGFFSAEDADSEGHEGKFYCWTVEELGEILDPAERDLVTRRFGVTPAGNFVDHSHPKPLSGQNVFSLVDPALGPNDPPILESALDKLRRVRARRVRPHLDDKILASWNGLMLGAFARASVILDRPEYGRIAERNLGFLQRQLWDPSTRTLHHRWRDGECDAVPLLDGYAFVLAGTLDLYEATLNPAHLEFAVVLAESMLRQFEDPEQGGFYQSASVGDLILRLKEDYDGAEPSGNSVATLALLRLAAITGRAEFREAGERTLRCFVRRLAQHPEAVPYLLLALDAWLHEPHRVVVAGDPEASAIGETLLAIHRPYQPNKVVLGQTGPVEAFARTLPSGDAPLVYVCTGTACQAPTRDPEQIARHLG
jgi:uncharacterized protein